MVAAPQLGANHTVNGTLSNSTAVSNSNTSASISAAVAAAAAAGVNLDDDPDLINIPVPGGTLRAKPVATSKFVVVPKNAVDHRVHDNCDICVDDMRSLCPLCGMLGPLGIGATAP